MSLQPVPAGNNHQGQTDVRVKSSCFGQASFPLSQCLLIASANSMAYVSKVLCDILERHTSSYLHFQGYYMKKEVFGRQGDFITSPEVSQTFGEVRLSFSCPS